MKTPSLERRWILLGVLLERRESNPRSFLLNQSFSIFLFYFCVIPNYFHLLKIFYVIQSRFICYFFRVYYIAR